MLGRVRASSMSSLEQLEMERPPSKTIKHDSLSIYEFTLLKLKQGSKCNPKCDREDSVTVDAYCTMATDSPSGAMTTNAECSSTDSCPSTSSSFQSPESAKEQGSRNMSILYFFSKYKSSQQEHNSADKEAMVIDKDYSSSSNSSVSPSLAVDS